MKNKKRVMLGAIPLVLLLLVGVIWMNNGFGNWSERNREEIEENVKRYVARYKLDPDKVEIVSISDPIKYPTGEEDFNVYIRYYGDPYITVDLYGNTDTLSIRDPDERIATSVFNELYLQARYDELSPTIDYLKSQEIVDPLRPKSEQIQYFQTSVGVDPQINGEIRETFKSGDDLEDLKAYIEKNLDKLKRLDTDIDIVGEKEGIDEIEASKLEEKLKALLPRSNYYAEIGVRDISTGESEGLFKMIRVP
ncbi:hypothetical protein HXA34_17015 [Salipaludibacillus agaradhaerens]|uniref:hypothetical protein n=1 Tax=Salipaludibacillus agaradhaerens TaxID=76935 RepID=UPI002150A922|nr:hypothetical protein [Salipaludibacillus agaradhaerens]MCR6107994.1 hypothetical protein [Salipaludibacillus agaradhaerens]MCR6120021.1 hypothetical protein [Salipaludibacillus agaradhaerens]